MSFLKKLFTTACLVTPMAAWAGCDTGYTNMYVYVTVNNNSTTPIQCESDNGGTTWLTFSSDFNALSSNQSAQGTACYADDRTDTVSGELVCYSMVNNGGVETRSQNIGTLYFEHQCSSSLITPMADPVLIVIMLIMLM